MHVAVRPPLAAAALVGVGVLAAPAVASMPSVQLPAAVQAVQTEAVDLLASSSVFDLYERVFRDAVANAEKLGENTAASDYLHQFVTNQVDRLTILGEALGTAGDSLGEALTVRVPQLAGAAIQQLAAGQVADAVNSVLQIPLVIALPATDLLLAVQALLGSPLQNLANIVREFTFDPIAAQLLLSGFIAPLISTPAAAAVAFQNVLDAAGTLDPIAVAGALGAAPGVILDGFLNGGYGPDLGAFVTPGLTVKAGGLLSPMDVVFTPDGGFYISTGGPIAALQEVFRKLTVAITPQPSVARSAVATVPQPAPTTVVLDTVVTPETEPAEASAPVVTPVKQRTEETVTPDGTEDTEDTETAAETVADDSATESDDATGDDAVTEVTDETGTESDDEDTESDETGTETDSEPATDSAAGGADPAADGADDKSDTKSDSSSDSSSDKGSDKGSDSGADE